MRFRLGTAEDLPAALELLRLSPCFRASDALWTRVMPAWRDWLQLGPVLGHELGDYHGEYVSKQRPVQGVYRYVGRQ